VTPTIREFRLRPENGRVPPYPAGSHIGVTVLIDGQPARRCYSMVENSDPSTRMWKAITPKVSNNPISMTIRIRRLDMRASRKSPRRMGVPKQLLLGERQPMIIHWWKMALCVFCCSAIVMAACFGQKPSQKPDDWAINNALIGPDSPIEVSAGSSYMARAMYPVPDGPLFPIKGEVTWSIEPAVKGISIDTKSGKISVAEDVPHGATASVHANVQGGKRKLVSKIYVYRTEENPLVGIWHVDTRVACGEAQEMKAATAPPTTVRRMATRPRAPCAGRRRAAATSRRTATARASAVRPT